MHARRVDPLSALFLDQSYCFNHGASAADDVVEYYYVPVPHGQRFLFNGHLSGQPVSAGLNVSVSSL